MRKKEIILEDNRLQMDMVRFLVNQGLNPLIKDNEIQFDGGKLSFGPGTSIILTRPGQRPIRYRDEREFRRGFNY